jgi:hypothetical protein
MQDSIIEAGGVPPLLARFHASEERTQEHAARCVWHLCETLDNQQALVDEGTIVQFVTLLRHGSMAAQEVSAAGLADLARGGVFERLRLQTEAHSERLGDEASSESGSCARMSESSVLRSPSPLIVGADGSVLRPSSPLASNPLMPRMPRPSQDSMLGSGASSHSLLGSGASSPLLPSSPLGERRALLAPGSLDQRPSSEDISPHLAEGLVRRPSVALLFSGTPPIGTAEPRSPTQPVEEVSHGGRSRRKAILPTSNVKEDYNKPVPKEAEAKAVQLPADDRLLLMCVERARSRERVYGLTLTWLAFESCAGRAEAGGIVPLIHMLTSSTPIGKEAAACALWHLALDPSNQNAVRTWEPSDALAVHTVASANMTSVAAMALAC